MTDTSDEVFEMRGVRGTTDDGSNKAWVQLRDSDGKRVRLAVVGGIAVLTAAAARRLADNLLELANRAEGRQE